MSGPETRPNTARRNFFRERLTSGRFVVTAEVVPPVTSAADVVPFIDRLAKFDPDIWVVEVEDRSGTAGLSVLEQE